MTLSVRAYSPAWGLLPSGLEGVVYTDQGTSRAKLQSRAGGAAGDTGHRMVRVGGTDRPVLEGALHLPLAAPVPVPGDVGTGWEFAVEAVGAGDDPALLNKRFLVVSVPVKSFATARRLDVVEL